jgi:hypothetical protein
VTSADFLRSMIASPEVVLEKLGGQAVYLSMPRRVATNCQLSPDLRIAGRLVGDTAFLLAYTTKESDGSNNLGKSLLCGPIRGFASC